MERLQGRVAVITGAGSGIGRGTALALSAEGVAITLVGRNTRRLEAVAEEISTAGGKSLVCAQDVSLEPTFETIRDATLSRFGRVDIVMNNAAAISTGLPEDIPLSEWYRVLEVNFLAAIRSNAVFLPILIAQQEGHLVNTASVDGLYGFGYDRLPYATSKAALVQLSEGLALYLRPRGVGVTCLCPGPVDSDIVSMLRHFGSSHDIHSPGGFLKSLPAEEVGVMVVDAIRRNRFLLLTHEEQVGELIRRRAVDMDQFIDRQIEGKEVLFRIPDQMTST